jgi:hypothetical protein
MNVDEISLVNTIISLVEYSIRLFYNRLMLSFFDVYALNTYSCIGIVLIFCKPPEV